MKNIHWLVAVIIFCLTLFGCEKGDPTALKEAVRAASLNISSITIEPADAIISRGDEFQFKATGHRADGSTTDVTPSVSWASSNTSIATVTSGGNVEGVADGSVSIVASLSSIAGSTGLTVSSAPLVSITILADTATPNDLSVSACKDLQLKALGTYEGESGPRETTPITDKVNWSVTGSASITQAGGLLSSRPDGLAGDLDPLDVQAVLGVTGSAVVTVNTNLDSITVAPTSSTLSIDGTLQYSATGNYADSSTADITANTLWTSSDTAVANFNTSDPNGQITGLAVGPTTITAACGSIANTGTASLTVTQDVVENIIFEDDLEQELDPFNTVVGATTQVYLMEILSDGNKRNVTENAQWGVYNNTENIVSVDNRTGSKGIVSALAVGTGLIEATYQQQSYKLVVNVTQ
ncbi:Ig-like domain-containing protein [Kaarinaea lacus]